MPAPCSGSGRSIPSAMASAKGSSEFQTVIAHLFETVSQLSKLHQKEVEKAQRQTLELQVRFADSRGIGNDLPADILSPQYLSNNLAVGIKELSKCPSQQSVASIPPNPGFFSDDPDPQFPESECHPSVSQQSEYLRIDASTPKSLPECFAKASPTTKSFTSNGVKKTTTSNTRSFSLVRGGNIQQFRVRSRWAESSEYSKLSLKDIVQQERLEEQDERIKSHAAPRITGGRRSHCFIIHPESKVRTCWLLATLSILLYDLFMVPFNIAFDDGDAYFFKVVDMTSMVFWTVDILVNSISGVYVRETLEMRLRYIVAAYARSWLAFDVALLLPEWVSANINDFEGQHLSVLRIARWGRMLRLLRLARVWRIAKLRLIVRHIVIWFKVSQQYISVTQGWIGWSCLLLAYVHLLACFWYRFGGLDNGWVQANDLTSIAVGRAYLISVHWTFSRLQGIKSDLRLETDSDILVDSLLIYCSLVLSAFYIGKVTAVCMAKVTSINLWKMSIGFVQRHGISPELSFQLFKCLEASHLFGAGQVAEEEHLLLTSLPKVLQQDLLFETRRRSLLAHPFFADLFSYNSRTVRHICNGATRSQIAVETEHIFAYQDACNQMFVIVSGKLHYFRGARFDAAEKRNAAIKYETIHVQHVVVGSNDLVSEPVVWTTWEHHGHLLAVRESTLIVLDSTMFAEVISQHKAPSIHAMRYAKHFVFRLNACDEPDDLVQFDDLSIDNIGEEKYTGSQEDHFMFISHYKVEAGTEATLMRDLMEPIMKHDQSHPANTYRSPIFIDSEDLLDLSRLKQHVIGSESLVILLTPGVLSRPWCLIEIVTAIRNDVNIVLVEIQRPGSSYKYPDDNFYAGILAGKLVNSQGMELLAQEGINLEDVVAAIKQIFLKISLPFSPHKTKTIREAELRDILKRCNREHETDAVSNNS